MKTPKNPITINYKKIKNLIKEKKLEEAKELLDWGIMYLAIATNNNIQVIDKVSIDLWKDRYWLELENQGLLNE
jgi:Tfp pilus assembly pilus retraction ATPase PilT